jgi:tryptophan synthase beta chain
MLINISGRGDKDVATAGKWFGYLTDEQSKALEANGAHGTSSDNTATDGAAEQNSTDGE